MTYLLLIVAAFAAGAINSVAGGGSFLTFPSLVFAGIGRNSEHIEHSGHLSWLHRQCLRV